MSITDEPRYDDSLWQHAVRISWKAYGDRPARFTDTGCNVVLEHAARLTIVADFVIRSLQREDHVLKWDDLHIVHVDCALPAHSPR